MVEASLVFGAIQTVGILIGVIIALQQLRDIKQTRETELETRQSHLFMQLFQHHIDKERWKDAWTLTEMEWDDFEDFARKYDSLVNVDNFAMRYNKWYFWEGMGLLLKKNLVDREMIYYLLGGGFGVISDWEKFGSIIKEMRLRLDLPEFAMWFEYLAEEMKKVAEEKGHPWKPPANMSFIREET